MTTVAFAQDWNVDSRTRIDMSDVDGDGNAVRSTDQRVTLGTTWGGSDWGIHLSSDVNYNLGAGGEVNAELYEAYASTDLMGYATVTAGRQALNYGSGALMSGNDWGQDRTTWDGMTFGLNLDMADITVGYHGVNDGSGVDSTAKLGSGMWVNAGGDFSGWNVNVLYMTVDGNDNAATGIDISGEVMGAGISASMNTDYNENTMRVLGLTYAVNDDMGVNVSQSVYSEDGAFNMVGTNMDGSWMATGGMGYLGAGDEDLAFGLTYNMGGVSMGATMHKVTNSIAGNEDAQRDVMEISLGYSLNDNASLSLKYATDGDEDATTEDAKYTWVTLNVGL
jgi:hypothetical protein